MNTDRNTSNKNNEWTWTATYTSSQQKYTNNRLIDKKLSNEKIVILSVNFQTDTGMIQYFSDISLSLTFSRLFSTLCIFFLYIYLFTWIRYWIVWECTKMYWIDAKRIVYTVMNSPQRTSVNIDWNTGQNN